MYPWCKGDYHIKNVVRSVAFSEIEEELTKLKKRKIARCLAYTNVKVTKKFSLSFLIVKSKMHWTNPLLLYLALKGLTLSKSLRLHQDSEDAKNKAAMIELQFEGKRLWGPYDDKDKEFASLQSTLAEAQEDNKDMEKNIMKMWCKWRSKRK